MEDSNDLKNLLSFRQYAKLRGCSPQTVSNAVAEGRISVTRVERDGKPVELIDPSRADVEWDHNTKTQYRNHKAEEKFTFGAKPTAITFGDEEPPSLIESRAWGEAYKAKISQIEYEKAVGQLLPVEVVERVWTRMLSNFRAKMIAVAPKVAPGIQGMEDLSEIEQAIREEIYEGLDELSEFDIEEYIKEVTE